MSRRQGKSQGGCYDQVFIEMQVTKKQTRGTRHWGGPVYYLADTSRSRTVYVGLWDPDRVGIDVFKGAVGMNIRMLKEQIEHLSDGIVFNAENHSYVKNGILMPSVTQIMKPLYDKVYGKVNQTDSDNGKDRGKEIHAAIEIFNNYGMKDIRLEYKGYLESFIKWLKDKEITVIASEIVLCHPLYGYAGTIDAICMHGEDIFLADYKTGELNYELNGVQLQAYTDMWSANNMPEISEKRSLGLSDTDYKQEIHKKYSAKHKSVFEACFKINQFIKEL